MGARILLLMTVLLAGPLPYAPEALAHEPAGTPRNYCEDWFGFEWSVHDYGALATGLLITDLSSTDFTSGVPVDVGVGVPGPLPDVSPASVALGSPLSVGDGNIVGDCNGDTIPADYDGHREFAFGGAWLSADSGDHATTGSLWCIGEVGHHATFGVVTVVDEVHAATVPFTISSDTVNLVPPTSGSTDNCGDFESDNHVSCVGSCAATFFPGLDGTYQVHVGAAENGAVGSQGHICSGTWCPSRPPQCADGVDNDFDGRTDYPDDPQCDWAGDHEGFPIVDDLPPVDDLPTGIPSGVKSCSVYNNQYAPAPYPGQNTGVVLEYDPPGRAGDVAFCVGAVTGTPCPAGQPGVVVNNAATCAPNPCPQGVNPDTLAACGVGPLCSSGMSNADPATLAACGVTVCPTGVVSPPGPDQVAVICGLPVPDPCPGGASSVSPTTLAACGVGPACPSGVTSPAAPGQLIVVCGQSVSACSLSGSGAGPDWTVGAQGVCVGLPWAEPAGGSCPGALVNVRVHWGSTPGLPPGGTFDACF